MDFGSSFPYDGFLGDKVETAHLRSLPGSSNRLRLFQINLLDPDSILAAIHDVSGVFHLASPFIITRVQDPQRELLDPAVIETLNVLHAAKESGVRRVVITLSISAIVPSPGWPANRVKDKSCWTDLDYCRQKELWYPASKTMDEKAAWEFANENRLDVVVVNPGTVLGPIIPLTINSSMTVLVQLLKGHELSFTITVNLRFRNMFKDSL
ncbi:phenylacetaldehyde reductase-like [Zingiber officinale]|uniref:phenylacetaldehyde reductase-like n=1 Tax=Zingiber officinale TaxID=94328 RepID=UPI001C4DC7EA|nr:phenylacetaldehyde reductase-like [Zingiber officinale]